MSLSSSAIRVGLCGLGAAAQLGHIPALLGAQRDGSVTLVAGSDRDASRRRAALESGLTTVVPSLDDLLSSALDLLVVATQPSAHMSIIAAALARDVDVLCEKPVGLNTGDVERLIQLQRNHRTRVTASVYQYRHAPAWHAAARLLAAMLRNGEPGTLVIDVERCGTDPLSSRDWRSDTLHEGGIIGDHGAHYVALCWNLDPAMDILDSRRHTVAGRESATMVAAMGAIRVKINLSYAGSRRHNRIVVDRPGRRQRLEWSNDSWQMTRATGATMTRTVGGLHERAVVNGLYRPLYRELFGQLTAAAARRRWNDETIGVARLVATALERAGVTRRERSA